MNDQDLETIARRLGARAAARLDVERTADAVVARLRRPLAWWGSPTLLRMAAAVLLTIGAGLFSYRTAVRFARTSEVESVVPGTLSTDELAQVLDSLRVEGPSPDEAAIGLPDLSADQLKELLHQLED